MKYPKPISDVTYASYKSHLRRARREGNQEAIKHWEDKIRLSFRPIPVDVDPSAVPERRETVTVTKTETILTPLTDAAYESYCMQYKRAVEAKDETTIQLWAQLIEAAGREVPKLEEPRPSTTESAAD